ncbi:MAG: proton-conducting membrane transporter [Epulopiscium sp.]|nr:proton-conducting membrane transporter [Candidatus Epulonipiscium sp.]
MESSFIMLLPIVFPIIVGLGLLTVKFKERKKREFWVSAVIILNALIALAVIFYGPKEMFTAFRFSDRLSLAFRVDGLAAVFGAMVSVLWIITTFYAFEYMKHEGKEDRFFGFFTITFGVVLGIAFSANMVTLYLFYEFLTLVTMPLVMHAMDGKARHAGKMYLIYMMFGASLAFIGFIFILTYGTSLDFVMGGVLNPDLVAGNEQLLRFVFVMAFFGFGVKAAVFPFYRWLPSASVAPTPVTALLHAVAVVKSGVFAIIRLTYYSFGTDFLRGTWAQSVMMIAAMITIVFGSTVALRTPHIKRRFAYSTISNLSYIIFGVSLMTPAGLTGGLMHMIFHAIIKITLFFCAGAILYQTHREYLYEVQGFGKKMPIVFATMSIVGFGLIGIPPFAGFQSKWALATAAVESRLPLAYVGTGVLIISALLTAVYLISIVVAAYFPKQQEYPAGYWDGVKEPNKYMTIPLILLTIASVVVAIFPAPLVNTLQMIANGLL